MNKTFNLVQLDKNHIPPVLNLSQNYFNVSFVLDFCLTYSYGVKACRSIVRVHIIHVFCSVSVSKFRNCNTSLIYCVLSFYPHCRLPQFKEEAKSFVGTNMKKVNIKDVLSDLN